MGGWCYSTNPIMNMKVRMITTTCRRIYAAGKISRRQNSPCFLELLPFRLQLLTKPVSSTFHYLSTIQIPTSFDHCGPSSCFSFSWQCTSWVISMYLICLCLVTEARGDQFSSSNYACEDAQNYYAGAQHLKGEALKKKLHTIIAKHQSLPYKKVWDAIKILDAADFDAPEASPDVVEIYSSRIVSKSLAGKPQGWNREHLWPRSYGLTKGPSLTDLHNIRPADVNVNSSRGNKYYGECSAATSYCLKPATKEAAADTETDKKRWTPPLQVRGDIARALMYMAVCYGFPESDGGVNLQLSDSPNIANKEMGLLSTLLRWNDIDLPSREEKLRNERVCKLYQHNRNPFVDHPEYANLIWGQLSSNSLNFHYWLQKSMD